MTVTLRINGAAVSTQVPDDWPGRLPGEAGEVEWLRLATAVVRSRCPGGRVVWEHDVFDGLDDGRDRFCHVSDDGTCVYHAGAVVRVGMVDVPLGVKITLTVGPDTDNNAQYVDLIANEVRRRCERAYGSGLLLPRGPGYYQFARHAAEGA